MPQITIEIPEKLAEKINQMGGKRSYAVRLIAYQNY
jgi:metal-responsive CopG/Arc/MetJ family transcriptional regulator